MLRCAKAFPCFGVLCIVCCPAVCSVLWQLFHYVPLQLDGWQRVTEHQTLHTQWEAYQKVRWLRPEGLEVFGAIGFRGDWGLGVYPCTTNPNYQIPLSSAAPQANSLFGQVVLSAYKPGDMVWVQDYHLMLLPSILKQTVPRMKVRRGGTAGLHPAGGCALSENPSKFGSSIDKSVMLSR